MKNASVKNIILIVFVTSLSLSFLIIFPVYIIDFNIRDALIPVLFTLFLRFLGLWGINLVLVYFFKITKYAVLRITFSIIIITAIDFCISYFFENIYPIQDINLTQVYTIRIINFIIFSILIQTILSFYIAKENEIKMIKENEELKFAKLEIEHQLLKQQINPHFIFNALNISKSLIKNSPKEAENFIIKLSEFIRASVLNDKKFSTLEEELVICRNYIHLQKIRFGNAFQYNETVNDEYLAFQLPVFSVITLLENAFKHNKLTEEKPLMINVVIENEMICVSNNYQPKTVENSTKTGLVNLNSRSNIFSGTDIIIQNDNLTFTVKIKLLAK